MQLQTLEQPAKNRRLIQVENHTTKYKKETESNPRMKQLEQTNKYEKMNSSTSRQAQQKMYP